MKMISINLRTILILPMLLGLLSCNDASQEEKTSGDQNQEQNRGQQQATEQESASQGQPVKEAMFTQQQFEALDMKIDTLSQRMMTGFVAANGQLEVPPQDEAAVTAVYGGNVAAINVIEGDQVAQGEALAYLSHPAIVEVQTRFLNAANQLEFQEKEFARQQRLYEAGVGSGEVFQRAEAELQNAKGQVQGLRAQLELLHLNPSSILQGNIKQQIPVISPIAGAVQKVNVKTGQYVEAQTNMFEIVNTHHVHAELKVFEKDVSRLKVGQEVVFTVESLPGKELTAEIISIGQTFEQEPKALHVHAEIENEDANLIPGMYVRGRINVENTQMTALPENAIARDGDTYYAFRAEREGEAWSFKPVELIPGASSEGWTAVNFLSEVAPTDQFAYNNAYYLMAQMNKGEGGHSH